MEVELRRGGGAFEKKSRDCKRKNLLIYLYNQNQ